MANQGYGGRDEGMPGGRGMGQQQGGMGQQQGSYSGTERRVGISYNYTGPERRHDEMGRQEQAQQGERRQTGGGVESGRGALERPYDEDINDQ